MEKQEQKRADVQVWLEKARTDLASARKLAEDDSLLNNAAYFCQQAAEKAIKAFLAYHNVPEKELRNPCKALKREFTEREYEEFKKLEDDRRGHDIACLIGLAKKRGKVGELIEAFVS